MLASAPGIKLGKQDAHAANASSAGRTPAASKLPQQQQHQNDQEGSDEREVDADERELLDLELDAADTNGSSVAASGHLGSGSTAGRLEDESADSSGVQQQGSAGVVSTTVAQAAQHPKVKPGQLGANGDAASEDLAMDAGLDETAEDGTMDASTDAAADELHPDVDALVAIDDDGQSADGKPQALAAAAGGSSQQQQSAAQQWSSAQQHSNAQTQDAIAGASVNTAASGAAVQDDSTEPSDEATDARGQPDTEPARDSFPAAKMQALGREAQEAKWAEEDAQRQRISAAASNAKGVLTTSCLLLPGHMPVCLCQLLQLTLLQTRASGFVAGQQVGIAKSGKQLAAPHEQAPAKQAAAGSSGQGVSDRDGAADGSTQPRAPAKPAVAGSGKGSAIGKAAAGSEGDGNGLAAKDKAAAAASASAKEAASFRRQLSELKTQVTPHPLCTSWHKNIVVGCVVDAAAVRHSRIT